jgi:hypothetical protein
VQSRRADLLFSYYYSPEWDASELALGWNMYNPATEYARMGLRLDGSGKWRNTGLNTEYAAIPTYPSYLVVPSAITDEQILQVLAYRSRGRFPAVAWLHAIRGCALLRSSQPKSGITRNRNDADEALIRACAASGGSPGLILDARPRNAALGNSVKGYGFENAANYEGYDLEFCGIDNIHSVRESHEKLRSVLADLRSEKWLSLLEATGWLQFQVLLIKAAVRCCDILWNGGTVLVHCSDGWDRTAQITSLAQILADPYYRTLEGFMVLIEKEWLSFGFRFSTRCGHIGQVNENVSPIFLQFLETVWQLLSQFPSSFEFDEDFLLLLADSCFSCRFGTFLYDCERERKEMQLKDRTISVWSHVLRHRRSFVSPIFKANPDWLKPDPSLRRMRLWERFYMKGQGQGSERILFKRKFIAMELPVVTDPEDMQ